MSVGFAILGAGRIGRVHARSVSATAGARLVAIADPQAEAAAEFSAAYGCDVRTVDAIAAADDIDAVAICTPTDTHADLVERFAKAGKAVFCEKPVDLSLPRVRRALAAVAAVNGRLMVGFQRRFDPDFCALKRVIDEGRIGAIEMVTLTSRDPAPPPIDYIKRSGGIFRDMTIHDFDVARWLLGEEIDTVIAAASNLVDKAIGAAGDFDSVNVILTTAGGKQATITNSRRASYGYDQRIEVLGSRGAVSADNHHEARIAVADKRGFAQPPLLDFFMSRYVAAYAAEIAAFVAAIETGTAPSPSGHDGLMALALAEAARLSVEEARTVRMSEIIEVPPGPRTPRPA